MSSKTLKPVRRGTTWHAQGRVAYNGVAITGYIRESTGASDEAGCWQWIAERTEREIRRHLLGERKAITFAEAVLMYAAPPADAKYLMPIVTQIGARPLVEITPESVRALGPMLYPMAGVDTWLRQVVTPVRAVINNAHDVLGPDKVAAIRIKGYSNADRVAQDALRGSRGRPRYAPGSLEWLLAFRAHATPHLGALALFMFATGARISQAVQMHPAKHLDLANGRACVPAAKGHADRWIALPEAVLADLRAIAPRYPANVERKPANLRVFGYASRFGPRKAWATACARAGIDYLPPHSAGRHGFGQEMTIRRGVDEKAVAKFGGWAKPDVLRETYTHAEDDTAKIHKAFRTSLAQAERATGLKLAGKREK
jgi:integrase